MKIEIKKLKTSELIYNEGQIEGLPKNPRIIRDEKYLILLQSIKDDPEMLEIREPMAVLFEKKYIVIGGNMRLKAIKEAGIKELNVKVIPKNTKPEKLRAYAIKDNVAYGEWDWAALGAEWNNQELGGFGLELWNEDEEELDFSILDEDDEASESIESMAGDVKKAIQIEFEAEDYQTATELIKFFREQNIYIGAIFLESLRAEKQKLEG